MPKETFYNLPRRNGKRLELPLIEFQPAPFIKPESSSPSGGIAKTSFYQYFEDKKDLFKYLIELMVEKILY